MQRGTIIALTLLFAAVLVACGAGDKTTGKEAADAESAYIADLNAAMEAIEAADSKSYSVDFNDAAAVLTYVEEAGAAYKALGALEAPKTYQQQQELITEGSKLMLDYLEALPEFSAMKEDDSGYQNLRTVLIGLYSQAVGHIRDGYDQVVGNSTPAVEPEVQPQESEQDTPDSEKEQPQELEENAPDEEAVQSSEEQ